MTYSIWKYTLETTYFQQIKIPSPAKILTIQVQHGVPCIWVLVDLEEDLINKELIIVGTGHPVDDPHTLNYVGSFQLMEGQFIGHLFEKNATVPQKPLDN